MLIAKGEYVASIDSDGQFDISEITLLIDERKKGFDAVTGYRKKKRPPDMVFHAKLLCQFIQVSVSRWS